MPWDRDQMAERARRKSLQDGFFVNLGIGIPTLVANYIPDGDRRHPAVGKTAMLGMGPFPYRGRRSTPT